MQKNQALNLNILLRLIIINLLVKHLMKIKQKELVCKFDIADLVKNTEFDKKNVATTLATKAELKAEQHKIINFKHLLQVIFMVKVILKMMVIKTI